MTLIECVPNFSEGKSQAVVGAIVTAIKACSVDVLNVSMDPDHNRSVITFVGDAQSIEAAAAAGIIAAAERIDLRQHRGVHPRIGAADVVPFIPLRDASMAQCVAVAKRVGERIGEWGLPVYLYEEAAQRPERRDLAYVRRGGYEALAAEISSPDREPDFGPARIGGAGAVALGARAPLIAFNVYLDSADVALAQTIARMIRTSGGGLPRLKAIGVMVGGRAQVSMNLTDFRITSLYAALDAVRTEAARLGVGVAENELIGLIPQAALLDYAIEGLGVTARLKDQILEYAVGAATGDYRPIYFE
jgi:glutamate formiminotransferase